MIHPVQEPGPVTPSTPPAEGSVEAAGGDPAAAEVVDTYLLDRVSDFLRQYRGDSLTMLEARFVLAALWIVGSLVLAWVLDWIVVRLILRLTRRTETQLDDRLIARLHGPIVKTTVLLGTWFGARSLALTEQVMLGTRGVILTLVILVWTGFALRASHLLLTAASKSPGRLRPVEPQTLPLFTNAAKVVLVLASTYLVIQVWNLDATGWIASAGIVGIAVGFAAQDALGNLFAGVLILMDAPYRVGDYINLESGERGQVVHIGLRSTRLLTRDDVEVTIPNAIMGNSRIVNETAGPTPKHRVRVPVSVAYGSDVARVEELLLSCTEGDEHVCPDPEPRVRFRLMADSGLNFELLAWIPKPELRGQVLHRLNSRVHAALREAGIEIPFPKRDLYIKEMPGADAPRS